MYKLLKLGIILLAVIVLAVLAGCSSSTTPTMTMPSVTAPPTASSPISTAAPTAATGPAVTLDITAQNIAFDKTSLTVPANARVTLNFNNKDAGIPHNVAFYTDSSASTPIYVGTVVTGPGTVTYQFTAPSKPGTYFFRCDIHPTIMTGSFIVQ